MLPITQWFESVNSIDDIISERRPLAIIPVLIFIVSIGHLFQVLVVQFVFVVIGEIRTKPNESAEVSRNAAVSPTKLFSTRSVDALASAAGAVGKHSQARFRRCLLLAGAAL